MKSAQVLFILLTLIISAHPSDADVRRFCLVAYKQDYGYSNDYKMEVTFLTGGELNKATKTYSYDSFSNYALLWFDKGEVAILKIDSLVFGVGDEFDNEDFKKLFFILSETTATQVNSTSKRKWRIKSKNFLNWVDPRVE